LHLGLQPCNIAPLLEIVVETNGLGFYLYDRAPLPAHALAEGLSGPERGDSGTNAEYRRVDGAG
jgi:hypothetical protein